MVKLNVIYDLLIKTLFFSICYYFIIFLSVFRLSVLLKLLANSLHLKATEVGRSHFIFPCDFKNVHFLP
jgi:hypothetical protein